MYIVNMTSKMLNKMTVFSSKPPRAGNIGAVADWRYLCRRSIRGRWMCSRLARRRYHVESKRRKEMNGDLSAKRLWRRRVTAVCISPTVIFCESVKFDGMQLSLARGWSTSAISTGDSETALNVGRSLFAGIDGNSTSCWCVPIPTVRLLSRWGVTETRGNGATRCGCSKHGDDARYC